MTLEFSPAGGWLEAADGLEPITWSRPGSSREETIEKTLRRLRRSRARPNWSGISRPDRVAQAEVVWYISKSSLSDTPCIGDLLTDAKGTAWTVIDVDDSHALETWRCGARDLIAYHGLDDYVDIERAEYVLTDSGAEQAVWRTQLAGVPARWGEQSTAAIVKGERLETDQLATVFLLERSLLEAKHRIRRADGTLFTIISSKVPDAPDQPTEVRVRPIPTSDPAFE